MPKYTERLRDCKGLLSVYNNEMAILKVCEDMERTGVQIDLSYVSGCLKHEMELLYQAKQEFLLDTGHTYMDSGVLFKEIFDSRGELYGRTEKGNASFASDVLEELNTPTANLINKIRHHEKRIGTYWTSFLYYADETGIIHPNMLPYGTRTGRFSYSNPNCLSLDTEVLTKHGWKTYADVNMDTEIACFDTNSGTLMWSNPTKVYLSKLDSHSMVSAKNTHMDMLMTKNHRCLFKDRKTKSLVVKDADCFLRDSTILHGAALRDGKAIDYDFLRLQVAVQADAHIEKTGTVDFSFHKVRKADRLRRILDTLGIPYTYRKYTNGRHRIRFKELKWGILSSSKQFTASVLELDITSRQIFFDELRYWDGLSTRPNSCYTSNHIQNIDIVQAVCSTIGIRACIGRHSNKKAWTIYFTDRDYSMTANTTITRSNQVRRVWCMETTTGFFLARRGGNTFITGNCQNIPVEEAGPTPIRRSFIPRENLVLVSIDYAAVEYKLLLDYAGEKSVIKKVLEGEDLHQVTADMMGVDRRTAKTLGFMILYGGGAAKLSGALGVSLERAKELKKLYLARLPKVKELISAVTRTAEYRGHVKNFLGRKLFMGRFDESYKLINHLIQGSAADVMKLSMVAVHKFIDGKPINMLLTVHDELVLEMPEEELDHVSEISSIMCKAYAPRNGMHLTVNAAMSKRSWAKEDLRGI